MRKLIVFIMAVAVTALVGCGGPSGSPKGVVNGFLNAMKAGDVKEIKKYITASDVSLIEAAENLAKSLGQGDKMDEKMQNEFKEKSKNVSFDVKGEKIEGDKATVEVAVTENGKTETQPFELKKEKGEWKVSLVSTGMNRAGVSQEDMQKGMEGLKEGMDAMKNISADSLAAIIKKGQEEFKKANINLDSLAEAMKKGGKDIEKMAEDLKKLGGN
jgi:hypothetical protein